MSPPSGAVGAGAVRAPGAVFLLFTSRLGCLGSLLVSLVLTVLLFVLFSVL